MISKGSDLIIIRDRDARLKEYSKLRTNAGMSRPMDAVASHVSAAVTKLRGVVLLRRATKAEQEQFAPSSAGTLPMALHPVYARLRRCSHP